VIYGKSKAIKILIDEGGADINVLDDSMNFTTAMLAIYNNHKRALKVILSKMLVAQTKNIYSIHTQLFLFYYMVNRLCRTFKYYINIGIKNTPLYDQ